MNIWQSPDGRVLRNRNRSAKRKPPRWNDALRPRRQSIRCAPWSAIIQGNESGPCFGRATEMVILKLGRLMPARWRELKNSPLAPTGQDGEWYLLRLDGVRWESSHPPTSISIKHEICCKENWTRCEAICSAIRAGTKTRTFA